jgi:hypothetical protein
MTPWFTGTPVRIGVYQRSHYGYIEYSYWTGALWNFGAKTAREARMMGVASRFQELPWRGLSEREFKKMKAANEAKDQAHS